LPDRRQEDAEHPGEPVELVGREEEAVVGQVQGPADRLLAREAGDLHELIERQALERVVGEGGHGVGELALEHDLARE
jgi:hypothetical protein